MTTDTLLGTEDLRSGLQSSPTGMPGGHYKYLLPFRQDDLPRALGVRPDDLCQPARRVTGVEISSWPLRTGRKPGAQRTRGSSRALAPARALL